MVNTNYKKILEDSFIKENKQKEVTKLEYLSMNIFDFTTYDSKMNILFAEKALEVCAAINEKTTFEYIKNPDNYLWYIMLCNTNFFASRLDWGSSIRGAWWDYNIRLESCGLWENKKQLTDLNFTQNQWEKFIKEVIEFSKN